MKAGYRPKTVPLNDDGGDVVATPEIAARYRALWAEMLEFMAGVERGPSGASIGTIAETIAPSPRTDAASDTDHDEGVESEAVAIVHALLFAFCSSTSSPHPFSTSPRGLPSQPVRFAQIGVVPNGARMDQLDPWRRSSIQAHGL